MLNRQTKQNIRTIDNEIAGLLDTLTDLTISDDDYKTTMKSIQKLVKRKEELTNMSRPKHQTTLSDWMPVIATVGGAIVIGLIEANGHTFTSKAAMLLPKPRA